MGLVWCGVVSTVIMASNLTAVEVVFCCVEVVVGVLTMMIPVAIVEGWEEDQKLPKGWS